VVGDVAKLDILYMYMCHGLLHDIQWLVMWQSWICIHVHVPWFITKYKAMAYHKKYPVVGDVAKLDMLYMHGLSQNIQWLVCGKAGYAIHVHVAMAYHKISTGWSCGKAGYTTCGYYF